MHPTKCLERALKYSYFVLSIILNYQFPKTKFADFLCLIALSHTLIALAHTLIALGHLNSTEKLHQLYIELLCFRNAGGEDPRTVDPQLCRVRHDNRRSNARWYVMLIFTDRVFHKKSTFYFKIRQYIGGLEQCYHPTAIRYISLREGVKKLDYLEDQDPSPDIAKM